MGVKLIPKYSVSRYFSTAVQFHKGRICTGLISIRSAYECVFYCQAITFFFMQEFT